MPDGRETLEEFKARIGPGCPACNGLGWVAAEAMRPDGSRYTAQLTCRHCGKRDGDFPRG